MFVSHNVLRWIAPYLSVAVFVSTTSLAVQTVSVVVDFFLFAQVLSYVLGTVGIASARSRSILLVRIPAYFLMMNAALAIGCLQFLRGATTELWTVTSQ